MLIACCTECVRRIFITNTKGIPLYMKRESFKSRLGFLLVSAGCAIGIGNVWRFPYVAGQNGGGWFVLLILILIILVQGLM